MRAAVAGFPTAQKVVSGYRRSGDTPSVGDYPVALEGLLRIDMCRPPEKPPDEVHEQSCSILVCVSRLREQL